MTSYVSGGLVGLAFSRMQPYVVYLNGGLGDTGIYRLNLTASISPGNTWQNLVVAGCTESSRPCPHTDYRAMAVDRMNRLLVASDGGIVRTSSTSPDAAVAPLAAPDPWVSLVGDMDVLEAHAVSYNARNDALLVGLQDNANVELTLAGPGTHLGSGDGAQVAVWSSATQSIMYYSSQQLRGLTRIDCPGDQPAQTSMASLHTKQTTPSCPNYRRFRPSTAGPFSWISRSGVLDVTDCPCPTATLIEVANNSDPVGTAAPINTAGTNFNWPLLVRILFFSLGKLLCALSVCVACVCVPCARVRLGACWSRSSFPPLP